MLSAANIFKSFGEREVLRGIDISVEPGQIVALIGPSGAGKTTLLRTLSLLDFPDSGKIAVDDIAYSFPLGLENGIKPPWPHVTVVFQQLFLWPHLTLRENIILPVRNKNKTGNGGHLDELIKLFDMAEFIDRYPNEASIGQRQRAALARALILDPSYILLDEITSALDVEQVSVILSYLQTLRNKGIGIILVTHLIGFARRAADRVVFLDEGKVIESGGPQLLEHPENERIRRFLSVIESAT